MTTPKVLDLFAGCGGISWGLKRAGFEIIAGIDSWQPALNTFAYNHPESKTIKADLTSYKPTDLARELNLGVGEIDCIVGGPPCQGFSKNIPAAYRFLDDPRNLLFREFLEFVAYFRPKIMLMENVAEIYNAYGGQVRHEILNTLTALGYSSVAKVLTATDYGVPQTRRRCFIVASRDNEVGSFPHPTHGSKPTFDLFNSVQAHWSAWDAISDLPSLENGEGEEPMPYLSEPSNEYQSRMRSDGEYLYDHITRKLNPTQYARVSSLQAGQGIKDLPIELRPQSGYSGAYGRLDFEHPAPTITRWVFHPGSGRYGHPRDNRLITIREAARLQSFSDDFRFTGSYIEKAHQIGNAVPPLLIEALVPMLNACLEQKAVLELPHPS